MTMIERLWRVREKVITVRIDFPALDALVAWLSKDTGGTQADVDALAEQGDKATARLRDSNATLEGAVRDQPE